MKLPKFNQNGITHLLAPIAFVAVFAAIGGAVMLRSHALSYSYISGLTTRNGTYIPYATVQLYNKTTGYSRKTTSDSRGQYVFSNTIVGDSFTEQAYKNVGPSGCTEYYSGYTNFVSKAGSIENFSLNYTKKLC